MLKFPIYLDYSATTPVDPRVAAKLIPWLTEHFGNAISRAQIIAAWESDPAAAASLMNTNTPEVYIHRLRKKLECSGATITTVRGLGYCFEKSAHESRA